MNNYELKNIMQEEVERRVNINPYPANVENMVSS